MISATVLTKNNQNSLKATLDSLKKFDEVIILDSGSTDQTLTIAKRYPNVTIHTSVFSGFGPMHNYATKLASHDWILSIDSDEILSEPLIQEILNLELNPEMVYRVSRRNYFNGKWIKCCGGWHPDNVIRLYHRNKTAFSQDLVHERILTKNLDIQDLDSPLIHVPNIKLEDFLRKIQHYSTLFAEQNEGRKTTIYEAIFHGWHAFTKSYLFKRGFTAGKAGFIISMYNGHSAFYKYLKLAMKS